MRHVVDHILVDLHVVGSRGERLEFRAELVLRSRHFVVVLFDMNAHLLHDRQHFAAEVLAAVDRVGGEVAALRARTVAEIACFIGSVGVRREFDGVEFEAGLVGIRGELHIVEDEEFRFRAEHDRVANTGRLEIGLCELRGAARVAGIGFARGRLQNVAEDGERRLCVERVDRRRRGVGQQNHVRLVDRLPAGNR